MHTGRGIQFFWESNFASQLPESKWWTLVLMGGRRVRCRRTGLRSRTCSTCLQTSAGVECSLTPKGDLRANQGVMAMSREVAAAPSWRYRSGSQKLTMSTSRTARRPTSGAPVHPFAALRFAPFGLGRAAFAALPLTTGDQGDQGKPGEPGHRSIGRGACRSAHDGWSRTPVNSSGTVLG